MNVPRQRAQLVVALFIYDEQRKEEQDWASLAALASFKVDLQLVHEELRTLAAGDRAKLESLLEAWDAGEEALQAWVDERGIER